MFKSYLRTAFRNLKKNTVTAFINLLGLSLGLATCLVAGLYIQHELSADQFHKDIESIYYIKTQKKDYNLLGSPLSLNETLENNFPEVESTLHTYKESVILQIREESFNHDILYADSDFLNFFTFPLHQGDAHKALSGLRQVVISDAIHKKYFQGTPALGQIIRIKLKDKFEDFEITGVALPPPTISSLKFDFIIPFKNFTQALDANLLKSVSITSFIKIKSENLQKVKDAMPDIVRSNYPEAVNPDGTVSMDFTFHPLADHYVTKDSYWDGGLTAGTDSQALFTFGGVAIIILLLACFNFMNLTNAQSSNRIMEVGVRKVTGADKGQLIKQFLLEAILLSVCAGIFALCIAELGLLIFKNMLNASITVFSLDNATIYILFFIVTVLAGLAAGSYPAFILSNLNALKMFKRHFKISGNNWLTRTVLAVQFGVSVLLVICAMVMWKQQHYLMTKDLGYNKDQLVLFPIEKGDSSLVNQLKNEIKGLKEVMDVARSSNAFTRGIDATLKTMSDQSTEFIGITSIDTDYLRTLGFELLKGENFQEHHMSDPSVIIVNETLLKDLNLGDSLNVKLGQSIGKVKNPTIIGVVKDFNHSDLHAGIMPFMFLTSGSSNTDYLNVRLQPGQVAEGLRKIGELYKKINPDIPFDYFFLDEAVQKQYTAETRWSNIITLATGMAVFLSALGLLGLAIYTTEHRRKEIGIRKVMGASLQQLITLLSKDYFWLIGIAFLTAAPLSYYLMTTFWLNTFSYRVTIDFFVYLAAFIMVSIVAATVIGSQTIRAARQNPTDTLKEQ